MKLFVSFVTVAIVLTSSLMLIEGRRFDRCSMARELDRHGFSRRHLADWVCLIEHESSYNTTVVGPPNTDGSKDYGLFQINSAYWCKGEVPSKNYCRISCWDLLSNDISDSVKCAKLVYKEQGFSAWVGWVRHCQGGRARSVDDCFGNHNSAFASGFQSCKW